MSMRIGIIGAGWLGGTVGRNRVRAGHDVMFSTRHRAELRRRGPVGRIVPDTSNPGPAGGMEHLPESGATGVGALHMAVLRAFVERKRPGVVRGYRHE